MTKLPKTIIVVAIKHSNKYSHLRKICKKFFEGIPHIVYTDYNLDSNDTYFIFPVMDIVHSILFKLYDDIHIPDILGYGLYKYEQDWSLILNTYGVCLNSYMLNPQWLPATVKIDTNDVKKKKIRIII